MALPEPLAASGLPNSAFTVEQGGRRMPLAAVQRVAPTLVDVAVVLDTSTSLTRAQADTARRTAGAVVAALPPGVHVAVVSAGAAPRLLMPPSADLSAARSAIDAAPQAGTRRLLDGLALALQNLPASPNRSRHVVVVAGGPDRGSETDPAVVRTALATSRATLLVADAGSRPAFPHLGPTCPGAVAAGGGAASAGMLARRIMSERVLVAGPSQSMDPITVRVRTLHPPVDVQTALVTQPADLSGGDRRPAAAAGRGPSLLNLLAALFGGLLVIALVMSRFTEGGRAGRRLRGAAGRVRSASRRLPPTGRRLARSLARRTRRRNEHVRTLAEALAASGFDGPVVARQGPPVERPTRYPIPARPAAPPAVIDLAAREAAARQAERERLLAAAEIAREAALRTVAPHPEPPADDGSQPADASEGERVSVRDRLESEQAIVASVATAAAARVAADEAGALRREAEHAERAAAELAAAQAVALDEAKARRKAAELQVKQAAEALRAELSAAERAATEAARQRAMLEVAVAQREAAEAAQKADLARRAVVDRTPARPEPEPVVTDSADSSEPAPAQRPADAPSSTPLRAGPRPVVAKQGGRPRPKKGRVDAAAQGAAAAGRSVTAAVRRPELVVVPDPAGVSEPDAGPDAEPDAGPLESSPARLPVPVSARMAWGAPLVRELTTEYLQTREVARVTRQLLDLRSWNDWLTRQDAREAQIARWSLLAMIPLAVALHAMLSAGALPTATSATGIAGAAALLGLTVLGSMWTWHVTAPPYQSGRVSWGGTQLESRRTLTAVEHLAVHLAAGGVATTSWPRLAALHQVPQAAGAELDTVDNAMSEAAELRLRATPRAVRSDGWLALAVLPPFLLCLVPACVLALVL